MPKSRRIVDHRSRCKSPCRANRITTDNKLCDPDSISIRDGTCTIIDKGFIANIANYITGPRRVDVKQDGPSLANKKKWKEYCETDDEPYYYKECKSLKPIQLVVILNALCFVVPASSKTVRTEFKNKLQALSNPGTPFLIKKLREDLGDLGETVIDKLGLNHTENQLQSLENAHTPTRSLQLYELLSIVADHVDGLEPLMKILDLNPGETINVLGGAHLIIDKEYYDYLLEKGAYERISSHYKGSTGHVGLTLTVGTLKVHILCGVHPSGLTSWVQIEGTPFIEGTVFYTMLEHFVKDPVQQSVDVALHGVDFLIHKYTGQQVGILGLTSPHTEKKGSELDFTNPISVELEINDSELNPTSDELEMMPAQKLVQPPRNASPTVHDWINQLDRQLNGRLDSPQSWHPHRFSNQAMQTLLPNDLNLTSNLPLM